MTRSHGSRPRSTLPACAGEGLELLEGEPGPEEPRAEAPALPRAQAPEPAPQPRPAGQEAPGSAGAEARQLPRPLRGRLLHPRGPVRFSQSWPEWLLTRFAGSLKAAGASRPLAALALLLAIRLFFYDLVLHVSAIVGSAAQLGSSAATLASSSADTLSAGIASTSFALETVARSSLSLGGEFWSGLDFANMAVAQSHARLAADAASVLGLAVSRRRKDSGLREVPPERVFSPHAVRADVHDRDDDRVVDDNLFVLFS